MSISTRAQPVQQRADLVDGERVDDRLVQLR
jgi:hypothetical protein